MKPTPLALALWRAAVAMIVTTMTAAVVAFAIVSDSAARVAGDGTGDEANPAVLINEALR